MKIIYQWFFNILLLNIVASISLCYMGTFYKYLGLLRFFNLSFNNYLPFFMKKLNDPYYNITSRT
jgi:hypothetical protein